ncbi:uncharacterized protein LOC127526535 [Erpetoichthys calabaricus]|uniref:uncharacterized protein LOC127526535 n=1 Tax=Erpetoichthys calabaricus TaxID=27687 RepID=UPI002234ADB9|nr:uncharacterized protein LOC127526535 [Erpetoichthys calabaricus]
MPENRYSGSSGTGSDSDREQPRGAKGRKRPSSENLRLLKEMFDNLEYPITPPEIPTLTRTPQIFQAPSPVAQPVNNFDIINNLIQVLNSDEIAILNALLGLLRKAYSEARTSSDLGPSQQPNALDTIVKSPQPSISGTSEACLQHSPVDDLTAVDNSALHPQTGAGVTSPFRANLSVDTNSPQPSTLHMANPSSPEPSVSSL